MTTKVLTEADHPLPPALLEGPRAFDKWSKRRLLSVEQKAATPTGPLYHYTDRGGLAGILEHEKLWCFSHSRQSDETEFEYSLALARAVLHEMANRRDFFERGFAGCLDNMLEHKSLASAFEFYLVSFCRLRDDAGQWRDYGRKGTGYILGFGPNLMLPERDDLSPIPNENFHIGRVLYGDAATTARHQLVFDKAAEITGRVGRKNLGWTKAFGVNPFLAAMARETMASQLIWNCLTAKHERFRRESEVRGIVMGVKGAFDGVRHLHSERPYVDTPWPLKLPGSVTEIIVGKYARADSETEIAALLRRYNYSAEIRVWRSDTEPAV